MTASYTAEDIEVLEGLEPVRRRPGMYIAGTDTPAGLHQLVFEILDNSVDEAMNGHAKNVQVVLHKDHSSITVSDDGRGIPVEQHPKFNKSALELILTTLHAGGKFSSKSYQTSGGLHGVGSSVVNALSQELIARVYRGGKLFEQSFARGIPSSALTARSAPGGKRGTEIFFRPDPDVFRSVEFSPELLRSTIQTKAYLNPGLRLSFIDEATDKREEFFYQEGVVAYLKQLLKEKNLEPIGEEIFELHKEDEIEVSAVFCWTESTREVCRSYANGIYTIDGGSHEVGVKNAIAKAVRNYIAVHDALPKGVKLTSEDIREGLYCLVSVKLPSSKYQVQFQGQTKGRLNNPEVVPLIEGLSRAIETQLNQKPSVATAIVSRITLAAKARAASRAASQNVRRKIGISHRLTLPGKLADCSSTKPEETEVFIVEGDSAGGSAKQGRDRHFQAVLPLRGKVLNVMASTGQKMLDNKELSNIVAALGCGSGDKVDSRRLRYGKVIILTDADADGMHIASLLLAFFFSQFKTLIKEGAIYLGRPPLFGIFPKGSDASSSKSRDSSPKKKGSGKNQAFWAYSEEERDSTILKERIGSPRIVRYKGLGEMNPGTLWETTLNPETRTLLRVGVSDEEESLLGLKMLMGADSTTRNEMIREGAQWLNLDL